ncbi:hypothetical protein [Candidatus Electronema sp. TJ]|uniref:hypothetical protein n=1 Tax=Candidatus Electronema sp. TJ TaxID=3401573 RepID=UPI003AA8C8C6
MSDQFEWKAEITFKGTAEEFNKKIAPFLLEGIESGRLAANFPGGKIVGPTPGIPAPDYIMNNLNVAPLVAGEATRIQLQHIPGIAGGIRTPHMHVGNEVLLLERKQFKIFVGEIARELAIRRVDDMEDHLSVMKHIGRLAEGL